MRRSLPLQFADFALLLAPVAELLLLELPALRSAPVGARLAGLTVALLAWAAWAWRSAPPARERWMISIAGGVALVALSIGVGRALLASRSGMASVARLEAAYGAYWNELEERAASTVVRLQADRQVLRDPSRAFELLRHAAAGSRLEGLTILIFGTHGEVIAWSGRGLLHEPSAPFANQPTGDATQSHASATAWVANPVNGPRGAVAWVVSGESRSTNATPPLLDGDIDTVPLAWGYQRVGAAATTGGQRILSPGRPTLMLAGAAAVRGRSAEPGEMRIAALAIAIGYFGLAALRGLAAGVLAGTVLRRQGGTREAVILVGAAGLGLIVGLDAEWRPLAWPLIASLLFAGLALASRGRSSVQPLIGSAGAALLLLGAAWHDWGALAPLLCFTGLGLGAVGLASPRWREPSTILLPAFFALFAAALLWEWGSREQLSRSLPDRLAALAPPTAEILEATDRRLERHFRAFDLAAIAAGAEPNLEAADLAYALWRDSPLARVDAASALIVEPEEGGASSFAYGLPLDDLIELDRAPARWEGVAPAAWRALERQGEGSLYRAGGLVGRIRWALVPRPGFGVRDAAIHDLPTTLLGAARSSDLAAARTLALPPETGIEVVIYGPAGEIELSPWREGTPQLGALRDRRLQGRFEIDSPDGAARFALREGTGTALALVAPRLHASVALERVGARFARGLFVLVALTVLAMLLALPRATARDLLRRVLRSYSKRLILLYSLLLLVPLVLLYTLLSESLGRRVERAQRAAAETALTSAERVLGEYVLSLEPGFGLTTALDDELLVWLSRVVRHEIHLYWNGEIYASSQRELFAAGFLPRRVPGEIWRAVALAGERLTSRTTRAGEASYVELYSPLRIPGLEARESGLLLSMPLLAQQEETNVEVALIRRRTMLATLGAFLLLAGVGTRLARSFTRPITDLVAGTRRIAAGAESLGVQPDVDELSALADAIDQMARRIAEGREQLLREKRLVEEIVEGVTSGVVCVDRAGVVLLANRQARARLDVEPGELLVARLAAHPELAEVVRLLEPPRRGVAQLSLRGALGDTVERDWSLIWVPLEEPGGPGGLLVVEDVSEVLRAQRLEAWAEMARLIAHEIKNPLTPIRLSTEHLRDAWQRDRAHFDTVFERCTSNILRQVEELREIASDFSIYSHIPKSERLPGDLVANLREVVESYRSAPPAGVEVEFRAAEPVIAARFDPRLLGRALRNLVENALRVSSAGARVDVSLAVDGDGQNAIITVADQGPGVPESVLSRIFEPYFSTHAGGTGLGMPIALRIAEEHGGSIRAKNRPHGGFEVAITIPLG